MRLERSHTEFLSQGEGLPVMVFGAADFWGIVMRANIAEEAEGPRLVPPFVVLTSNLKGTLSQPPGFIRSTGQQIRFA